MYLDLLLHGEPITRCHRGVRTGELVASHVDAVGAFLSVAADAVVPRLPGKSAGRPWGVLAQGLTSLVISSVVLRLQLVFPFTSPCGEATPDLLLPLKRRRFRQPSPHRRVAEPFRPWLIGSCLPTVGRRRASPVMTQNHFLQAAAGFTRVVLIRQSASPDLERKFRIPVSASSRGGDWRTKQAEVPSPEVTLPGPYDMPPSPVLPVATRWLLTPAERAEFEQGVLYGCGSAQVGFRVNYPPFIASPFLLKAYLVPSHCGSRAPPGLCGSRQAPSGRLALRIPLV